MSTRYTIALLADWFDEPYQEEILRTVEEAALQRGANCLSFAGGIPGSNTRESSERHRAFELLSHKSVDGAILLAGTMVNERGPEALAELVRRLDGVPLCAVGVEIDSVPSVLVDNRVGIEQAVTHLVERHRCQRLAFVRGPHQNREAEQRFEAFRDTLKRLNVELDPRLIFEGDFIRASGAAAVHHFKELGAQPDALIASNDEMALGAQEAFTELGLRVPEDVRVIGFDDIESARHMSPPLTTARQPLRDLAVAAVRTIMDQIVGRQVAQSQTLQSHLIVRESCGCDLRLGSTGRTQGLDTNPGVTPQPLPFAQAFASRRQSLRVELARAARGEFLDLENWEERLLNAFANDLADEERTEFNSCLSGLVGSVANSGGDVFRWHDIVTAIRRAAIPCCGNDLALTTRAEELLQGARLVTAHAAERAQARKRIAAERFTRTLAEVGSALMASYHLKDLAQVVVAELPRLGITACYLSMYEPTEGGVQAEREARLIAFFDNECAHSTTEPFPVRQLGPTECWPPERRHRFMVLPLFLKGKPLGFVLLESKTTRASVIEVLREQLSIALFGALLAASPQAHADS